LILGSSAPKHQEHPRQIQKKHFRPSFCLVLIGKVYTLLAKPFPLMTLSNQPMPRSKGFTLIITISLLVLLTLVGIGLLSLSAITLRGSAQANAQRVARDNARMALIIALGQLQKHVGTDTRITATADMAASSGGNTLAAGAAPANNQSINAQNKGLTAVQNGSRYWTGVWQNRDLPTLIPTRTPSPQLIQWLVSGNEHTYTTTTAPNHAGILPSNANVSVGANGNVSNPSRAVVLAGRNSVGDPGATTLPNYVAAPLVDIKNTVANVNTGRYAWWVGDEGVKAKINVPQQINDSNQYASLSAQRRGWDSVTGFAQYPLPNAPNNNLLPKVATVPLISLFMPGVGGKTAGVSPLQSVFHSATTDSFGLIVDNLNGGTKVDLHKILSGNLPTARDARLPATSLLNYPIRGRNIISSASAMRAPRWDALKDFYDRGRNLTSGTLQARAAADNFSSSIAPLIADFRLLMGVRFVALSGGFKANPCGKIAITLANPYSVPLRWNTELDVEVRNVTLPGNLPSRIWNYKRAAFINGDPSEEAVFNNALFRIPRDTLQPGEARAYTVANRVLRPAGTGASPVAVSMGPLASSAAFDFNRSVELDVNVAPVASFSSFDVRESWQTTQVTVDMRQAGTSWGAQSLRRIERFELDNGFFSANSRTFAAADLPNYSGPVPMMLYSFQISRPGIDYSEFMPLGYEMGQRASTMRTFYDFNLQGTRFFKSIASYNPAPFFMESTNSISQLPTTTPGGDTGLGFVRNLLGNPLPWGRDLVSGSPRTVLFTCPTQFTSLAQFQHADLTGDDLAASLGHQPAYAVGNSYANPYVRRTMTSQPRTDYEIIGVQNPTGANMVSRNYYDIAYLLNASLWDSYYLSAQPAGAGSTNRGMVSENPALISYTADTTSASLNDPITSASKLMIDGAFNVNSTDKNAWKAFLGSSKHFRHRADTAANTGAAFPRTLEQLNTSSNPPTGSATDSFSGYRRLTDVELEALATEMVRQVRLRGPFLSHSHFINRFIGDITRNSIITRSGALQSAIDESGININIQGNRLAFRNVNATSDRVTLAWKEGAPRADLDGMDRTSPLPNADSSNPDWAVTSTDNNYGAVASIIADREMLKPELGLRNEQGFRSTAIPGWLKNMISQ
jgi:Tfp pilus assembly protein PilX